jgi:hypothetical protein
MPDGYVSEAQADFARVEQLKQGGLRQADAIRQVARERGKNENTVRINHHRYRTKTEGGAGSRRGSNSRPGTVSVSDAVSRARSVLEEALAAVDEEARVAKSERDAAQARYEEVMASAKARRAELEAKIAALA